MDTCSAESHTGRRGSHLNTNQTSAAEREEGQEGMVEKEERERETAGLLREIDTVN